jgi:hypothetical protein
MLTEAKIEIEILIWFKNLRRKTFNFFIGVCNDL